MSDLGSDIRCLGDNERLDMELPISDDYYGYGPRIDLDRHIAIIGPFSDMTRTVGYRLAALLGLSASDLDRRIEHEAGMSIRKLVTTRGEEAYRAAERRHFNRCLKAEPCNVLTLGDGALIAETHRRWAQAETHLIALDLDLANYYWRLSSMEDGTGGFFHWVHGGAPTRFEQVRPSYEDRRPGLDAAAFQIPMTGNSVNDLAEIARQWLLGL